MLRTKNYRDSLFLKYNVDSKGNPVSIKIDNESAQVSPINYTVHLMQIPDESYRMTVTSYANLQLYEVFDVENLGENNYKVDYAHGIIYFHPVHAGKTMTITYYGRGVEMIYAGRVLLDSMTGDNLGDMLEDFNAAFAEIERLEKLIDRIKEEFEKMSEIVYADQPLLALQAQIELMRADNFDHVRWRESSKNDGILTHRGELITNEVDHYLIRSVVDSED